MTGKLPLTIVVNTAGHTVNVKNGTAPIEGVDAKIVEVTPIVQAFRRMVRNVEFDVCELAPTTYMMARGLGAPYIARVIEGLKRSRRQPVIVFGVETGELLGLLAQTGADVVGVDWRVPLDEARRRVGQKVALQGNLDPACLFLPPAELEKRVVRVLEEGKRAGPGHVFNLGHGILPSTPVEHARALVQVVHEHRAPMSPPPG